MARLDDIIHRIKDTYGIKRIPIKLNDKDVAVRCFCAIGDAMLLWTGRTFDFEPVRAEAMALIDWTYMTDDSLDYTKGILLKGNTGIGKTFLMKIWAEFVKIDNPVFVSNGRKYTLSPVIANARTIASEFSESQCGGADVIRRYSRIPCLVIDDIGAEGATQSSFGNKVSVISDIVDKRNEYAMLTFGTSNLTRMAGEGGYDDRTARRMGELFNVRAVRQGYNTTRTR